MFIVSVCRMTDTWRQTYVKMVLPWNFESGYIHTIIIKYSVGTSLIFKKIYLFNNIFKLDIFKKNFLDK